jgi:hypothetical protein
MRDYAGDLFCQSVENTYRAVSQGARPFEKRSVLTGM